MQANFEVVEVFHWTREGCSPRAIHVVEHDGFERTSCGFRITKNGQKIFTAYPPFATRQAAEAKIATLTA